MVYENMELQGKRIFITGGAGFFGELLKNEFLNKGAFCVSIDLEKDNNFNKNLVAYQEDIRSLETLESIFSKYKFNAIFHCAAILAHSVKDKKLLWTSNVDGTRNIAELAKKYKVPKVVFTSSNCLWAENFNNPVTEDEIPRPIEIYGKSKREGEKILLEYTKDFHSIIIRCPSIIDSGRVGLLSILFDFIMEGRRVWVIDNGNNIYQFIYAKDLVDACIKCMDYEASDIFNIGSDNVKTFRKVYEYVIKKANTNSRVATLPKEPTLSIMRLAYALKLSPLGPYQNKMISKNFIFDTNKIKKKLKWMPTLTNEEILYKAYEYYRDHLDEIKNRKDVSAHKKPTKMGIIRLLKWVS